MKLKLSCWLVAICALFVFFSCSKGGSSPANTHNTIVATIDGKTETFNNVLIAKNTTIVAGAYQLILSAASNTTSTANAFSLTLSGSSPIAVGTYPLNLTGGAVLEPAMAYQINGAGTVYQEDYTANNSMAITISSLTGTNITGTFSGKLKLFLGAGDDTKTVTNGTFNVDFK